MYSFVLFLEILGIGTIVAAMIILLVGDGAREQKFMCFFLCGSLVQNVGYLLELTAPTMEAAMTAVKVEYLGSTFIPLCYCWFMYYYCFEKPPKPLLKVLCALNCASLPIVLTVERHDLFYSGWSWVESAFGHHYLDLEYGVLYPVTTVIRIFIPYALSLYVLLRTMRHTTDKTLRRQYSSFLAVSALPIVALIVYAAKLTNIYDLTPVTLGLAMALVVILVWGRRDYDFRRVASDVVLDSMSDGVVVLDEEQRLVSCNRAAAEIFPQLRDRRPGELVNDPEGFWESLMDEGMARTLEMGDRFYESHAKQITTPDGRGEGYVILVLDITDTRNYIDEIMRIRVQAEQANVAKSEFLANMSHEIRTPMNAIIGLSDILMEESYGRKIFGHAKDIQSAAKNLLAIINDILDLSKVEAGKMELVLTDYHIRGMVGGVTAMMEVAAAQRGLELLCEYDESIPCRYHGDEGRIKQILINLTNNAVKFTRQGHVCISVQGMPGGNRGEELLVFSVEDTGCGIREEDRQAIFEDFKQVDSKRNRQVEGTGLGLSITKHLVQLMGGTIEVQSEYGVGSTFTVTIPQQIVDRRPLSEVPEPPEGKEEQTVRFTAPGFRVLVVDDNTVNRKVAAGFLKPYGFDMDEAGSGPEAIEQVKQHRYDIIFMDYMMPGMDGIEATHIIRQDCGENGTGPAIVALTANAMEGVREKFLQNGFDDFIAKPLDRKALHELLLRWVPEDRRREADGEEEEPAAGLDPSQIHIEGVDPEMVVKFHAGNIEDYRELLELYCMDGKRKMKVLRECVEEEDFETYEIEVHALKSASANIGAMTFSDLAKSHEEAALRGDEEYIRSGLDKLLSDYEVILNATRAFLGEGEKKDAALPSMDAAELREKAGQALERLERFRSHECLEIVEEILEHRLQTEQTAAMREIYEQLKMYEDDTAEDLLRQFIGLLDKEE